MATLFSIKRPRKLALTTAARAVAATLLLSSGGAHAIGMLEAYRAALQNDPTYRMAVYDNAAGQEYKIQGRANLLPNLSASYYTGKNRTDITAPNFLGIVSETHPAYTSDAASITLRQPIVSFDGVARYQLGIAQTKLSDQQFAMQKQELVMRVVSAYIDALFIDDQVRLATAQRDMYLEQRRVNDTMFKKGEGTKTDMLETQARLDASEAQVLEILDQQTTNRNTLAGLIGKEVKQLDGLPADFKVPALDIGTFEEWRKTALANNPELLGQTLQIEAARQQIKLSRAGHAPRLDFIGSLNKNDSETLNTRGQESMVRSIGLQLTIPLYSGGSVLSATRQSVANYEKAKSDFDARTEKTMIELRKQYNLVQTSKLRIAALEKSQASAALLVEATTQSIKGGVRINLDLLNAVQQQSTAQRDLAQGRYNFLIAYLRLRQAGGVLSERDVLQVAGYFNVK